MFGDRIANLHDPFGWPPLSDLRGRQLGRVLTKMHKVTREQVIISLVYQQQHGGLLGEVMIELGYVGCADVAAALAAQRGEYPCRSTRLGGMSGVVHHAPLRDDVRCRYTTGPR